MKIMHISTRLILGGSQENTVFSCAGQADAGHAVSLVFGPIEGPEGNMLPVVRRHGGIETIETPNLIRELSPRRDLRCLADLRAIIREHRPDVVHTHSSKAGVLGRAAAWREGVPAVIHTIHGLPFHPYQSKLKNAIYIAAERWAARRCHAIVTVADAMRDQALAAGVGRAKQFETVRSGMIVEPYLDDSKSMTETRRSLGLPEEAFIVGTVARLAELKGHDDLLDAFAPMMRSDPNLHLLWVGDGYWSDRLLARVRDLNLSDQVHTPGLVLPETIPDWIRAMDVVVHPSYREGLPRAVVQGLLAAKPVVAYALDGAPEVCIDDETGMLVQPGDHQALAEAVFRLRADPGLGARLGAEGRRRCRGPFDRRTMVDELERIYRRVIAETEARA
ncbi:MAG: glycosyltransferase family 4 protein [Phycisphaerales bacterium]|nr:glycosyltransferase family 4 protein [Phycisphaerales bacterium]